MRTVKLVTLTDEEKKDVETSYNEVKDPKVSLEEIIEKNNNQTYVVLKIIGNKRKSWGDIEDMVTYTGALKKVNTDDAEVELDNDEVKLIKRVLEESVKNDDFGITTEKLADVYKSFCV